MAITRKREETEIYETNILHFLDSTARRNEVLSATYAHTKVLAIYIIIYIVIWNI